MNNCSSLFLGLLIASSMHAMKDPFSNHNILMKMINDLYNAFTKIEPCGDNYDTDMDSLASAINDAKIAAETLMTPKKFASESTINNIFATFDAILNHLRGEGLGKNRWHRPEDKTQMQDLFNTLGVYPSILKQYEKELHKKRAFFKIKTESDLKKNVVLSLNGCVLFVEKILNKLDHYIHEPESAAASPEGQDY